MSSEQILMCQNCHMTFESNEELTIHSCVKIKEENQDSKDKIDSSTNNGDNFKAM
jgi:protein-arginine kinase activator protein McsA